MPEAFRQSRLPSAGLVLAGAGRCVRGGRGREGLHVSDRMGKISGGRQTGRKLRGPAGPSGRLLYISERAGDYRAGSGGASPLYRKGWALGRCVVFLDLRAGYLGVGPEEAIAKKLLCRNGHEREFTPEL